MTEILLCFMKATVIYLFWLTKHMVVSADLSAPDVVTGAYGGSLTVSCQYDLQFRENKKYWCRGFPYELCKIVVRTPKYRVNDRTSIQDDKEAQVFTVKITSLKESDVDWYWCVVSRPGRNVFSMVKLQLSETVSTPVPTTQINALLILEQDQISWWAILRWILFILMVGCLVLTHVFVWRIKSAEKTQLQQQQQQQQQQENNYE